MSREYSRRYRSRVHRSRRSVRKQEYDGPYGFPADPYGYMEDDLAQWFIDGVNRYAYSLYLELIDRAVDGLDALMEEVQYVDPDFEPEMEPDRDMAEGVVDGLMEILFDEDANWFRLGG